MLYEKASEGILRAFYAVYNGMGYGFLEKVYENALAIELREMGFQIEAQKPLQVHYKGHLVGEYIADIVVDGIIIVELKAAEILNPAHVAQLVNYLRASKVELGFVLNFGKKPTFERRIYEIARSDPR